MSSAGAAGRNGDDHDRGAGHRDRWDGVRIVGRKDAGRDHHRDRDGRHGCRASTAAAIASAALRALESRARIAANAGGIARGIFARSGSAADAGGAGFAGRRMTSSWTTAWPGGVSAACASMTSASGAPVVTSFVLVVVFVFRVSCSACSWATCSE